MGDKEERNLPQPDAAGVEDLPFTEGSSGKRNNLNSAQSDCSAQPSSDQKNGGNDELDASGEVQSPSPRVVDKYAKEYNMNHPHRGVALILNHVYFKNKNSREGSIKDCDRLRGVLTKLGFAVRVKTDFNCSSVMETLENLSQEDHSENDCLVVAVLTHGSNGKLYARDKSYNVERLWENFTADRCPSLAGKPKIFVIQACRGVNLDSGIVLKKTSGQTTGANVLDASDGSLCYTIPYDTDFIFANGTMEGYYAWRNPEMGSWFIQHLCEQLEEHHREHDLQTILTFVSRRVTVDHESTVPSNVNLNKLKQIPCVLSMLTRLVYVRNK